MKENSGNPLRLFRTPKQCTVTRKPVAREVIKLKLHLSSSTRAKEEGSLLPGKKQKTKNQTGGDNNLNNSRHRNLLERNTTVVIGFPQFVGQDVLRIAKSAPKEGLHWASG